MFVSRRIFGLQVIAAAGLATLAPPYASVSAGEPFVVIVNAANPTSSVSRRFLYHLFLKRVTHWPSDNVAKPVDLAEFSPQRQTFSEEILNRSVSAVKAYWQQQIFGGRSTPPPELATDADVVVFVAKNAWAIGYVSPSTKLEGVKAVVVR